MKFGPTSHYIKKLIMDGLKEPNMISKTEKRSLIQISSFLSQYVGRIFKQDKNRLKSFKKSR